MLNVTQKDLSIIKSANITTDEVFLWANSLYTNVSYLIPTEIVNWLIKIQLEAFEKATTTKNKSRILYKIYHTNTCILAGMDIIKNTPEIEWNMLLAQTICLLHDTGRFPQAVTGTFIDKQAPFDHAEMGVEMISNSIQLNNLFTKNNIDKNTVVEAVKNHNKLKYKGTNIYAKFVRDADKLAIVRWPDPWLLWKDFEGNITLSKETLDDYLDDGLILNDNVKTKSDVVLSTLSWEKDFNFKATSVFFKEEGIKNWLLNQLITLNPGIDIKVFE